MQLAVLQPLRFESFPASATERAAYLSRGNGYAMLLTPDAAVISLDDRQRTASVRMTWPGANRDVQPVAIEPAPGFTNYLIGSDSGRWRRNVPSFGRVRYPSLYRGIDPPPPPRSQAERQKR